MKAQHLRFVRSRKFFRRLQFDQQTAFHQQICAERHGEVQPFVLQRHRHFALEAYARQIEFFSKALGVVLS